MIDVARRGGAQAKVGRLSLAQTGNGWSEVADRGGSLAPALLIITTLVGATPTCTYAIEGSMDGEAWHAVAYCDSATPETISVATFAITSATIARKVLRPNHPWRYLRVAYTLNTNVTNTVDIWAY